MQAQLLHANVRQMAPRPMAPHFMAPHFMALHPAALHRMAEISARLPAATAVLVGLGALAVVTLQELWRVVQHVTTIAHEGAHALVGSAAGRTVTGVQLKSDGEGGTGLDPAKGPGYIVAGIVGYLGPSGFGLLGAKLISLGYAAAVLWLAAVLTAIMLPMLRNWFGVIPVVVASGLALLVVLDATTGVVTVAAYGLAWFLLVSGIRDVLVHNVNADDAKILRRLTYIPKMLWVGFWLMGTTLALLIGGSLLV